MGFDSISNAPLPALNKDFAKKKRTNRLAKLKQSKLDVRREQWLSQVKNKECKMGSIGKRESPQSPIKTVGKEKSMDGLESKSREEEIESSSVHDSDMESLMGSPIGSSLDHSDSSKCHSGSSSSSTSIHDSDLESLMSSPIGSSNSSKGHSSSSSTSSGYCSGSVSEEEEEDDDCLDNWETIADALNAKEDGPKPDPVPNSPAKTENKPVSDLPKTDRPEVVAGPDLNRRAWSSNDALRPQTLPNLLKQQSFVMNSDRQCSHWKSVMSQPSSCPICCEDLDVTDTSFLPCSCGFRLCLFCHKRILEADGRCPGCRKHYDSLSGNPGFNGGLSPFRMVRSCSMSSRS